MSKTSIKTKVRFDGINQMGCVICSMPCEIHHLKGHEFGTGMSLKAGDRFTIGLCTNHHRGLQGFHSIGKRTWEEMFETQQYYLDVVDAYLELLEQIS